jgi:hypothetical protein
VGPRTGWAPWRKEKLVAIAGTGTRYGGCPFKYDKNKGYFTGRPIHIGGCPLLYRKTNPHWWLSITLQVDQSTLVVVHYFTGRPIHIGGCPLLYRKTNPHWWLSITLQEDQSTFLIISRSFLLRTRNISDKRCTENQNTHFVFSDFFFL